MITQRLFDEQEAKEPKSAEERAEESMANLSYSLQTLDSSLDITVKEPVPRDMETVQKLQRQHKVQSLSHCYFLNAAA